MIYKFDNFEIDSDTYNLHMGGELQHVEPLVFDLLYFLVQNPDRIISRDEIIDFIWDGKIVSEATISSCIKSARKALGDSGEQQKYIKTIRGRGIQFTADIENNEKKEKPTPSSEHAQKFKEAGNEEPKNKVSYSNLNFRYITIGILLLIAGILFFNTDPSTI